MTSPAFNTVLVRDSRLNDISDVPSVKVFQGASQNTYQRIAAESQSSSAIIFNVQPPSESIVIDRHICIQSDVTFTFSILGVDTVAATRAMTYGVNDAFQSFPLNKLFTSVTAQINNTNLSLNQQDVLDMLLMAYDNEDFKECEGLTPYQRDALYYNFNAYTNTDQSSVLADSTNIGLNGLSPRGSFSVLSTTVLREDGATNSYSTVAGNAGTSDFTITIKARFTEPLFLSPFISLFNKESNNQGFLGISGMSFVFNIDSTAKRSFSRINPTGSTVTCSVTGVENSFLLVNYLSTNVLDRVKANNSIPYYQVNRFITANLPTINNASTVELSSSNIQLNQVPELILIAARKKNSAKTINDADAFLTIDGISVNFNNASGLLSGATRSDLYYMSKSNGSKQTYNEWSDGLSIAPTASGNFNTTRSPLGCVLFINPSKDLSLPSFISNGSVGQYNLQYNLRVKNNTGAQLNGIDLELVTVVLYGGMLSTYSGSSSVYNALLNKEIVLSTANENAVSSSSVDDMVGSGFSNKISSAMGGMMKKIGYQPKPRVINPNGSINKPMTSKLDRFS